MLREKNGFGFFLWTDLNPASDWLKNLIHSQPSRRVLELNQFQVCRLNLKVEISTFNLHFPESFPTKHDRILVVKSHYILSLIINIYGALTFLIYLCVSEKLVR